MDPLLVILRLVHVGGGILWAGAMLFVALFLEPSMRAAGPPAGAVLQQLHRLRYFTIMPVVALLTLVSGFWLYWKLSAGFDPAWMGSRAAMSLGAGGALSLVAFAIGVLVLRPATLGVLALAAEAQQAQTEAREAIMARAVPLRARMRTTGRVVAALLGLAVITMAVARYL